MDRLLRENLVSCSDRENFCFSLTCKVCGNVWKSLPIPFSGASVKHTSQNTKLLFQNEFVQTKEIALIEATKHFHSCKLCGAPTCDDCIVSLSDMKVCKICADRLENKQDGINKTDNEKEAKNNNLIKIFDRFNLSVIPSLHYFYDESEKRALFIEDHAKTFLISFEENMECMDLNQDNADNLPKVKSEYRNGEKYLHQSRIDSIYRKNISSYAFFHMELKDVNGNTIYLPGQMTASASYKWSKNVEPVLKMLLDNIII